MKLSRLFAALAALTSVGATDHHETSGEQLRVLHSVFEGERLFCTLYESHSLLPIPGGQGTERLACATGDGRVYTLTDVPTDFFDEHPFVSGSIRMSVLNSCVYDSDYINMTAGAAEMLDSNVANLSANTKSVRTLIVMRVVDSRSVGPTLSKAALSDGIFGTGEDIINLSSGYASCSGNKQQFVPGEFIDATDGVMDLTLSVSTEGKYPYAVEGFIFTAMSEYGGFNPGNYDHIMWVVDPDIDLQAYGYINWKYSMFQDLWAARPSALIHQLGHNLGHLNSGQGADQYEDYDQYGDKSCMMGYSYSSDEGPVMCFNAAKSWHFNWYSRIYIDFEIDAPSYIGRELNLIGIDDYVNGVYTDAHVTVVMVRVMVLVVGVFDDLYLMYNRKKGINSGTVAFPDTVNIVSQRKKTAPSWTQAQLSAGQTYTYSNYGGLGLNLVITVCEMTDGTPGITPDVARILVYIENADQPSCTQLTPSPTNEPSTSPTVTPTNSPTPQPITPPTNQPTTPPTVAPTNSPTPQPITPPTNEPTTPPTNQPTTPPTVAPTNSPTPQPITPPTNQPTTPPTVAPTNSPTPQPITPPTNQPIAPPSNTNCVDDPSLRFLWKIKKGTPKVYKNKSCRWLLKQKVRPNVLKRVCKKNACKNDLLEPRRVCPEACEFCETCDQNIKSKFFKETKNGKDKKKSCKWLQNQKPKNQIKYCSITESPFCYGTAKEICPKVCKAVTGCDGD